MSLRAQFSWARTNFLSLLSSSSIIIIVELLRQQIVLKDVLGRFLRALELKGVLCSISELKNEVFGTAWETFSVLFMSLGSSDSLSYLAFLCLMGNMRFAGGQDSHRVCDIIELCKTNMNLLFYALAAWKM